MLNRHSFARTALFALAAASTAVASTVHAEDLPNNYIDAGLTPSSDGWKVKKDKEGVKVSFKKVPGSSIKAFKGESVMNASLGSIIAAMKDPETCEEWVYGCVKAVDMSDPAKPYDFVQHGVNDLPWPAKDRDYVIHSSFSVTEGDVVHFDLEANPETVEVSDDYVRIEHMLIHYELTALDDNTTEIIWTQHTDPNGVIPGWIVNMLLVDIPAYSISRLESLANSDAYKDQAIDLNEFKDEPAHSSI